MPRASGPEALRRAKGHVKPDHYSGDLEVAYMRLLIAYRSRSGVRLSADEVRALFTLDHAIGLAAENIEQDLLDQETSE
jgi:hypothetical protein